MTASPPPPPKFLIVSSMKGETFCLQIYQRNEGTFQFKTQKEDLEREEYGLGEGNGELPHFHHCPTGLMGSEKNTLGKILSHILGYSFYDSAALIEQEVDGNSVAEIFKCHGESFFRKNEVSQQMPSLYAHMLSFLQFSSAAFTNNSMHQVFYDYGLRSQSGCRSQLLM
ncbi:hypothetical protein V6N13_009270 [Hibiscus sabdariffa]